MKGTSEHERNFRSSGFSKIGLEVVLQHNKF